MYTARCTNPAGIHSALTEPTATSGHTERKVATVQLPQKLVVLERCSLCLKTNMFSEPVIYFAIPVLQAVLVETLANFSVKIMLCIVYSTVSLQYFSVLVFEPPPVQPLVLAI